MTLLTKSATINVMVNATRKAAKAITRDFGEMAHLQVSRKGTADFATNADHKAEKILYEELKKARPEFGFLMEEGGEKDGADPNMQWVIDPIDGTSNFIHAVPYFCISVGLERRNYDGTRDGIAGVIYDPIRDEVFMAERGQGAFVSDGQNERRLAVSGRRVTDEAMLVTNMPRISRKDYPHALEVLTRVTASPFIMRCGGASALDLAYVAAGRYDGAWYHTYQRWDVAAGLILIREAGGKVLEMPATDKEPMLLLATNDLLHEKIREHVRPVVAQ